MTLKDEPVIVPLEEATAQSCGGKASTLGALLRAGLPVPDGFVVPFAVHDVAIRDLAPHLSDREGPEALRAMIGNRPLPLPVVEALARALEGLGDPPVAVRSSAADEDTRGSSAAGRYESVLAVRGVTDVAAAVGTCWASLHAPRATACAISSGGDGSGRADMAMAVIVQRHLDADVSGVMFTPAGQDDPTLIEASWGLGPSVVTGTVTPDAYRVHPDGTVASVVADKPTRLDRVGPRLLVRDVPAETRRRPTLDAATATGLATLGNEVADILGVPQDIEWAVADDHLWLLQARPITAAPPAAASGTSSGPVTLTGTPGSRGTATGTARTVRGPQDFGLVRPGDILICPLTDPAWTPLLRIAAGVITETGGALSHAAIVAREHHIPAVLGVPRATTVIANGTVVTIDGAAGTVITPEAGPPPTAR